MASIDSLSSQFPITFPVPSPLNNPDIITIKDVQREEDLLRNPSSFRTWWTVIHATHDSFNARIKNSNQQPGPSVLGPLTDPLGQNALQRLTYLYEAALVNFSGSFKVWKAYLNMRMSFVLGRRIIKKRAGGKKKFPEMKAALEEEKEDLEEWEGGMDPVVGWEEWKSLVAIFERALMWLPKVRP
jgi:pre-mRNA-splicing factor SYF1